MTTTLIFYGLATLLTVVAWFKDREKTKMALKKAYQSFMKLMPAIIPMLLFVGILLTLIPPQVIGRLLGDESGGLGVLLGIVIGSIAFMPSFVAFPLGQNLLIGGAGYMQVAVFIATLMAVGVSTLTVEVKYFGKKLTLLRNVVALIASILFAILIGVILT